MVCVKKYIHKIQKQKRKEKKKKADGCSCFISATGSSDFTVWHHGIECLNCWVALHSFARDSVPAHPGNNETEGGQLD